MIRLLKIMLIFSLFIFIKAMMNKIIGIKIKQKVLLDTIDDGNVYSRLKNKKTIRDLIIFCGAFILSILSGYKVVAAIIISLIAVALVYSFEIARKNAVKKQVLQDLLNISECLRVQISAQIPLGNSLRSIPELCRNKEFSNLLKNVYLEYELSKFIITDSSEVIQIKFNYPEIRLFISALNQQIQGASAIEAFDNLIEILKEKYIEFLEESTKSKMAIMTIGVFGIVLNIAAMGIYPIALEAFNAINIMLK